MENYGVLGDLAKALKYQSPYDILIKEFEKNSDVFKKISNQMIMSLNT